MKLIPHGAFPPRAIEGVEARAELRRGPSQLEFRVAGEGLDLPPPAMGLRTDGLWQRTCFELFVKPVGGEGYFEFNFSPSTQWAAYRFERYREGMAELTLRAPRIEPIEGGIRVAVDLGDLPTEAWLVGLSAVIAERDGTKSYWALAHPSARPDFHHPDCFAFELPAAS